MTLPSIPLARCLRASQFLICFCVPAAAVASAPADLSDLSLTALSNLEVTSVSKSSESLQQASASIYVITHDAIRASAATNVIQALRLAPNILVTQLTASSYVISARGFGGNPAAQSFANKILVLIDGRSVYTPLYSGVYADAIDVPLEEIDRIEVISGPGATLWGANAMNGVVNIITRSAYSSKGSYADLGAGNQSQFGDARWGDSVGRGAARIYALGFHEATEQLSSGERAHDEWEKYQGGFRYDFSHDHDDLTVQGDLYRALENDPSGQDGLLVGANLLARYQRHEGFSDFQAQAYFDQNERIGPLNQGGFVVHTYDLELQESLTLGRNRLIVGGGERFYSYGITSTSSLIFEPEHRDLSLGNIFLEDSLALPLRLTVTGGLKLEDDPFSGWSALPDLRFSWLANDRTTLWAAASRAIRSPTPFDTDVLEKIGPMVGLQGASDFRNEKLNAYQFGVRSQPLAQLSLSLAAYEHQYDDIRTIEPAAADVFFPLHWANLLQVEAHGLEFWATWQVAQWLSLSPGAAWEHQRFAFKSGASGLLGPAAATDDPSVHANLDSMIQLPGNVQLYASLRYVGAAPAPALAAYVDADARIGRKIGESWEVSIAGTNLLHGEHLQFAAPNGEKIYRSVLAEIRWRH
jgi:iron complex outermembrane receptor protein